MRSARTAFVVLGAHRSGTSAMARVLNLGGLGALPADLVPPHPVDNPDGFWESRSVIEFNDAVLADMGARWDRPPAGATICPGEFDPNHVDRAAALLDHQYGEASSLVLKDPRISLLVPLWHEALTRLGIQPTYVVMLRHPVEVAASLRARDGLSWQNAIALWTAYTSAAEIGTRGFARAFVTYDRLMADWRITLRRFSPEIGDADRSASTIDAFLSPERRRRRREDLPAGLEGPDASRIYDALLTRAAQEAASPKQPTDSDGAVNATAGPTWLLVTGAPRSGTSLMRALLVEHPQVGLLQEYGLTNLVRRIDAIVDRPAAAAADWDSPGDPGDSRFNTASRFYRDRPDRAAVTRGGGDPGPAHFGGLALGLFGGLFPGRDLRILGDKMPISEAWEDLPLLFARLPGFRVVVVIRNPVDVVRSSLVRRAATERGRDAWPIRTVAQAVAQWIAGWRTVRAMAARYGPAVRIVKYEDLCDRPQGLATEIGAWLGLSPHGVATRISALPPDLALHSAAEQAFVERCLDSIIRAWPTHDAETLVTRFAAPAPPYLPGEPIRLSHEDATPYLVSGFSFREDWGRWTDGPCAVLSIPHGLSRGLLLVEIGVLQAFGREGGVCDIIVRSGWGEPKLFQLAPERARIAFVVGADETEDQGTLRLDLIVVRPKRADELPADSRALGILVETVTVSLVSDGPPTLD